MPDKNSELTQGQVDIILKWLDDKWTNRVCAVCGTENWEVDENLAAAPVFNQKVFQVGGPIFPWVVVTCKNCGQNLLFSAVKMRLMDSMPGMILGEVEDVI